MLRCLDESTYNWTCTCTCTCIPHSTHSSTSSRLISSHLVIVATHEESYIIPGPDTAKPCKALRSRGDYEYSVGLVLSSMYYYYTIPDYLLLGRYTLNTMPGVSFGTLSRGAHLEAAISNTGTGWTRTAVEIGRSLTAQRSRSPRLAGRSAGQVSRAACTATATAPATATAQVPPRMNNRGKHSMGFATDFLDSESQPRLFGWLGWLN